MNIEKSVFVTSVFLLTFCFLNTHVVFATRTEVTVSHNSPIKTPIKAEQKFFSPIRREMVKKKPQGLSSPQVRKIYRKSDRGNYWSQSTRFKGKTVYQVDKLFDPSAKVLNNQGQWETNLNRMKRGFCPIATKGTLHSDTATRGQIRQRQKYYRIELHHVTQRDTGLNKDPIIEMTYAAHMSKNGKMIIEPDKASGSPHIIHSSLEKNEALKLCKPGQKIVTNVLHFRRDSLIDRSAFNRWAKLYWQDRAEKIDEGKPNSKPALVRRLFTEATEG